VVLWSMSSVFKAQVRSEPAYMATKLQEGLYQAVGQ
jgi:hypothetical protein